MPIVFEYVVGNDNSTVLDPCSVTVRKGEGAQIQKWRPNIGNGALFTFSFASQYYIMSDSSFVVFSGGSACNFICNYT